MKRASYRDAVAFIALNDSPGDEGALDATRDGEHCVVYGLASVLLISEIFGVDQARVANDVVRFRVKTGDYDEEPTYNLLPSGKAA